MKTFYIFFVIFLLGISSISAQDLIILRDGDETPFNKDNIDAFYISCFSAGDFKLKIWDVKIFF